MTVQNAKIPTFALFGEDQGFPDVLHIETIHERAGPLDWRINVHRHANLVQFLFLEKGSGVLNVEGTAHKMQAGTLVFIPQGIPHGFQFEPEANGRVLSLPSMVLQQTLLDPARVYLALGRVLYVSADAQVREIFDTLGEEFFAQQEYRTSALMIEISRLLLWVLRQGAEEHPVLAQGRQEILFAKFKASLEENFRLHLSAQAYAAILGVSPSHLNRVCKTISGQAVSQFIKERMLHEARRLLAYTSLTIAAIGYELGYQDPAYFGRVFREGTGQSPGAFRRSVTGEQRLSDSQIASQSDR